MIRVLRVVLVISLVALLGAALGALIGVPFGQRTSFFAATVVATLAVLESLRLVIRFGWFDPERRRGGAIGGLVGLAVGAPFVVMGFGQPWLSIAGVLVVGLGAVVGAGPAATR